MQLPLQVLQVLQVPGTRWVCSYSRGSPQNSRAVAPLWGVHWGHDLMLFQHIVIGVIGI